MDRLTKRSHNGTAIYNTPSGEPVKWENNRHNVLQKLADYEDAEEHGLLLKLPCKEGSTLWSNDFGTTCPYEVTGFSYKNLNDDEDDDDCDYGDEIVLHYRSCGGAITGKFAESEIGKTIFLTREEAEKKLEELRGTE